jgi:hypothetical protein
VPTLGATTEAGPLLEALLPSFGGLFVDPVGLPPKHAYDHRIILKHDTQPVVVRPYRYPAAHKDELERHCAAMMEQGIVCADAHMPGAGKIGNIFPINNIFPIGNICPISNIYPIGNICPIGNVFPIGNI